MRLRTHFNRASIIFVVLVVVYLSGIFARSRCGNGVFIRNNTSTAVSNVVLVISSSTDNRVQSLPDISPDAHVRTFIHARGKTDIALEFIDSAGNQHSATIMGYTGGGVLCNAHVAVNADYEINSQVNYSPERKSWIGFF